jgi:hypothetical protein
MALRCAVDPAAGGRTLVCSWSTNNRSQAVDTIDRVDSNRDLVEERHWEHLAMHAEMVEPFRHGSRPAVVARAGGSSWPFLGGQERQDFGLV